MALKSRAADALLVIALIAAISGTAHFVITNPMGPSRLLYKLEAPLVQWHTRCSQGAPGWMPELQRYATRHVGAPASQLAYITPEGTQHHCETGWQDGIWGDQPLPANARFRFASTTKAVTAIAILDLINEKKLSLETPIAALLGLEGPFKDARVPTITIGHLLAHKAGWDRVRGQDAMFMMNVTPWCPYKPETLMATTLIHTPGETRAYSNLGYCLLGLAIEAVEGVPYRQYMAERYGFADTTLGFIDGPYQEDEVQSDFRFEGFYASNYHIYFDFNAVSSAAGLSGSATDLASLIKQSLTRQTINLLDGDMSTQCQADTIQSCYGHSVYRYQPNPSSEPVYIQDGKLPGATSALLITPNQSILVWLGAATRKPGQTVLSDLYKTAKTHLTN